MSRTTFLILLVISLSASGQEIALTFDDAPTADGPLFSGDERTQRIVHTLKKHGVNEAAFFVLTGNIRETTQARLKAYSDAGHILANHSHRHLWMHQVGTKAYVKDLRTADSILRNIPGYMNWYRYPYLDEGRTVAARDSVRIALQVLNLKNGYVTVDNYDWYLNNLLKKAKEANRKINMKALRDVYVQHIHSSIRFYDDVATRHLGRAPKHVLLLHENDLAALFLDDLIESLKSNGWKIISPRQAYEDPISRHVPDVLFNGQGRIAAIAREKGVPARELVQDSEDEEYLEQLVISLNVFE